MADNASALRKILILEHLSSSRHPVKYDQLVEAASNYGRNNLGERSMQRDLQAISQHFPLRQQRGYGAGSESTWQLELPPQRAGRKQHDEPSRLAG